MRIQGREIAIIVAAIVVVIVLLALVGGGVMGPGMMGWWGYGGYGFAWWGVVMALMMLVFWALIIGGIVLLVSWLARQGQPAGAGPRGERPLDILRERYARGEITREQYEEMRRDLES